jgi:hypothetical protein
MLPVNVYPPGESQPSPPPGDYVSYLDDLTDFHAELTNRESLTVDGRRISVMTIGTEWPLDGVFGCPAEDLTPHDCFGIQPEAMVRLAVVEGTDRPLLVWAGSLLEDPAERAAFFDDFDTMLEGLHFP